MIRNLRVKATGQWAGPAMIGEFADDGTAWADDVCVTLGLAPGDLVVVDGAMDARTGVTLDDPHVGAEPTPQPPSKLEQLLDAIATAKDLTELKAAAANLKA